MCAQTLDRSRDKNASQRDRPPRTHTLTVTALFANIQRDLDRLEAVYKAQTLAWERGGKDFARCKDLVDAAIGGGPADSAGESSALGAAAGSAAGISSALISEEELGGIAELLKDMGQLPLALRMREHVVERVRERVGSEEGEGVGGALRAVGWVLYEQGKLDAAMILSHPSSCASSTLGTSSSRHWSWGGREGDVKNSTLSTRRYSRRAQPARG